MAFSATTPSAGALANDTPESSIESGLVSETAVDSNLGERLKRVQQTTLYLIDALLEEPAMWRLAERAPKSTSEVGG
jgi:hypothetical protein